MTDESKDQIDLFYPYCFICDWYHDPDEECSEEDLQRAIEKFNKLSEKTSE